MLSIEAGSAAVLLSAAKGLDDRVEQLKHRPGFGGGAIFKPVGWFGEKLAYTRWHDMDAADDAFDSGDAAAFRATPVEAFSVRLEGASDDVRGTLRLDAPGMVVLAVRMAVNPSRHDDLVGNLQRFTDDFLLRLAPARAVAFHRSPDRSLVIEVLHVTGALALARLQLNQDLRRHTRKVAAIARSETHNLLRLERIICADQ